MRMQIALVTKRRTDTLVKTRGGRAVLLILAASRRFTARYRKTTCLVVAAFPVIVRLSLLPYLPIPEPEIHDEFSYLLGADTFASGRLANPMHPMWVHFETFHINSQPTYVSKYPPAQSLFLALGQKVFGHPWYGVLISINVMCACICWMLQGWLRPHYALLGSLFAIADFGVFNYWVNSYWGGAVPAAGGALVLGGLARLVRRESASAAVFGILGMVLLANSRPYEGMVLTVACCAALVWWRKRRGCSLRTLLSKPVVVPCVVLITSAGIWFGYYNWRTTGKPWLMPYVINQRTYGITPAFWLLPEGPMLTYRHEILRQIWSDWCRERYSRVRAHPTRLLVELTDVLSTSHSAAVRLLLFIAVLLVPTRRVGVALAITAVFTSGVLMVVTVLPHYYAPAIGLLYFLAAAGGQQLMVGLRKQGIIRRTLTGLLVGWLFLNALVANARHDIRTRSGLFVDRPKMIRALLEQGSNHLVFVRYAPSHNPHEDWVYNRADIDKANIVWERDMGVGDNCE